MFNLLSRLPYQITGDNYEQLKTYDANSRKKISILGWFAIIPTFLWFLSSFLLCYKILETELVPAMVAGSMAAMVIFIFERNIVQSAKVHGVLMLLRVTLGLFIALFGSVILDLVIFKSDIEYYAKDKFIASEEKKVKDAKQDFQVATDNFNHEMEGSSNSRMKGFGSIAKEKKVQVADEKQKLADAQARLEQIKNGVTDINSPVYAKTVAGMGLNTILKRVMLLHEFVSENVLAFWAWFVLLMIGVLLEVFGVLTKCFYPRSAYEQDQQAIELLRANKRRMVLEQSGYYTNLGVHGREAMSLMENRTQNLN